MTDTGTTYVLLPPATMIEYFSAALKAKLHSTGLYTVSCDPAITILPDFTITFTPPTPAGSIIRPSGSGGINLGPCHAVIPGEYFIGNPTGDNDGMCEAAIGNMVSGDGFDVILGDVFLASQLVVFDLGDPNGEVDSKYPTHGQIGFAPKPVNTESSKEVLHDEYC